MYARTAAFDQAISGSHLVSVTADVLDGGQVLIAGLPVLAGTVDVDGTADVRRRVKLTVLDDTGTLTPNDPFDALSPYGREIRVYRGVQYPGGAVETLPLGTFRIAAVEVDQAGSDRKITLTGFDRARSIARARLETPYVIAAGTNYVTAIRNLLLSRLPSITMQVPVTTRTTPLIVLEQMADPWKSALDMAESLGCELFFDPNGVCVLRAVQGAPSLGSNSWTYASGDNATILSVNNTLDDDPGYNGAVVDGEPPELPPVHAVVYDLDPTSPTYANGQYGKVPIFLRSIFVATQAQANEAALALMLRKRGGTEQVKFRAIPHPAHEVGDLVSVVNAEAGLNSYYVIESLSIPLELAAMDVTCRKRSSVGSA